MPLQSVCRPLFYSNENARCDVSFFYSMKNARCHVSLSCVRIQTDARWREVEVAHSCSVGEELFCLRLSRDWCCVSAVRLATRPSATHAILTCKLRICFLMQCTRTLRQYRPHNMSRLALDALVSATATGQQHKAVSAWVSEWVGECVHACVRA